MAIHGCPWCKSSLSKYSYSSILQQASIAACKNEYHSIHVSMHCCKLLFYDNNDNLIIFIYLFKEVGLCS